MPRQTISTITDKVIEGMIEWQNRPLDPVIFIDANHVKIRDEQVANRPINVALAVTCAGRRDSEWAGDGGEGAKYWPHVLTELKNRGVGDVLMVVCDGLTGLPDAITTVRPQTITQICIVHLLRNSFRLCRPSALGRDRQGPKNGLHRADRGRRARAVREFTETWGRPVPGDRSVVEALGRLMSRPPTPGSSGVSTAAGSGPTLVG